MKKLNAEQKKKLINAAHQLTEEVSSDLNLSLREEERETGIKFTAKKKKEILVETLLDANRIDRLIDFDLDEFDYNETEKILMKEKL